jgi:glucose/arabinose dehydrogenase
MRHSTRLLVVLIGVVGWPATAQAQLSRRVYASGFSAPVAFVQDPTDPAVQFVVEQGGRIRRLVNGTVTGTFLDLSAVISSGGERGLLGLAFAPDYASSRRLYVNFTNPAGNTVVARFTAPTGVVADPASRRNLRWDAAGTEFITQPFSNHNGGNLVFGPDGYLYIGMGDGGSGDDPGHLAQNPASLLGKMLRIDVNVPDENFFRYRIPPDNPFVSNPSIRPEIWAFGLRNPWRYSFDDPARGGTGALVIGDVGQSGFEEVDYQPAGLGGINWGWRNREGAHDHISTPPPAYTPLTDPIYEYSHASGGVSITGGFIYRGTAAAYRGRYFFADLTGAVWSLGLTIDQATGRAQVVNVTEHTNELGPKVTITSFGVDAAGRLYIVDYGNGRILAIDFPSSTPADVDGDSRSDAVVWRPGGGVFFTLTSRSGYTVPTTASPGAAGDVPLLGEIDGDGRRDVVVWRPSTGTWMWLTSSSNYASGGSKQWGNQSLGDVPLVGDLDGDGRTDLILWRASTGTWFWLTSSSGYAYANAGSKQWGNNGLGDQPLIGDFDGDGRADLVVWRPGTGTWHFLRSSSGYAYNTAGATQWGNQSLGDVPRVGDFDADGISDFAVWRASSGTWFYLTSSTSWSVASSRSVQWGNAALSDQPLLADIDADGKSDFVVWRPSNGTWYWLTSSSVYNPARSGGVQWGNNALGDVPVVK